MSATKPPSKQSMKEVPRKFVTVLAEVAFPRCIEFVKYVTRLTAIPSVVNLSHASTPNITSKKGQNCYYNNIFSLF